MVLQTLLPEAIVTVYDPTKPDSVQEAVDWADVLVIGCGLGTGVASRALLSDILRARGEKPTVLDADGLNLLARNPSLIKYAKGAILTPHMGEMERLCGQTAEELLADSAQAAYDFSQKNGVICVLKSHRTAVSDGTDQVYVNTGGNSGMATGGSGDVLAGIIGGLLAQGRDGKLSAMEAACLGVYLHGLCGDAAARELSEYSVMASDLLDAISRVLRRVELARGRRCT